MSADPWVWAAERLRRFLLKQPRLTHLLEGLPDDMDRAERRRGHRLLCGAIRQLGLLEHCLSELIPKRPRAGLRAGLLIAGFELLEVPEKAPQIVSHAVDQIGRRYSKPERKLANAVLRRLSERIAGARRPSDADGVKQWAIRYSHPSWLIRRWLSSFGKDATLAMLEANQMEAAFWVWESAEGKLAPELAASMEAVEAEGFWRVSGEAWPLALEAAASGQVYVQNPAAAEGPDWLAKVVGKGGAEMLDLCAAPGGKSLRLRRQLGDGLKRLVAVDLPGSRFDRMVANFEVRAGHAIEALAADVRNLKPDRIGLFDGVLLDAPCSNTGVLRRKPDAKWRLQETSLPALAELQLTLLRSAAALVRPGGYLLYSVCSVEPEENAGVAAAFEQEANGSFKRVGSRLRLPTQSGLDGAGLHLFRRAGRS